MKKIVVLSLLVACCNTTFAARDIMPGFQSQNASDGVVSSSFADRINAAEANGVVGTSGSPIATQLQAMQKSITDLKGLVEIQNHQIEQLQVKQQILESALAQKLGGQTNGSAKSVLPTVGQSQSQQPVNETTQPTTNAATTSDQEQSAYEYAFQFISNKQYSKAISGMQAYLSKYPTGQYAANAYYWLGELYAIAGNEEKAVTQFNNVVNNYSSSSKAPDAMLKLGVIAYGNNQYQQAKTWFEKITKAYPSSSVSRIAAQQLLQLEKAGY